MTSGEAVRLRIEELCRENEITVNKLATMSGITQSTLNNIISGRNRSTTIGTIQKICDGFRIGFVLPSRTGIALTGVKIRSAFFHACPNLHENLRQSMV